MEQWQQQNYALHALAVRAIMDAYTPMTVIGSGDAAGYVAAHNEVFRAARELLTLLERAASHPQTY